IVLRVDAVRLTVAGRTDAGVHAMGQVCSYEGEAAPVAGLNALLPDDVAAISCSLADEEFDARRDATSRAYCYRVLARPGRGALERGRALHWPGPVDVGELRRCASALVGVHDFTAFTPTQSDHVRFSREVFAAEWRVGGAADVLEFWIEADSFMRHMNRVLVGTMLEVAGAGGGGGGGARGGGRSFESFEELLRGAPRSAAGPTAPAHGLYLVGVGYEGRRVLG
ncbi:MAG: tRNA pseudouridine(38-40) synthase TruA, partial [Solirubrobacterales bacterium]|nr:tRNA pseudouridine(38-40) synthase TruA [Solirubrobacterales bacterium]